MRPACRNKQYLLNDHPKVLLRSICFLCIKLPKAELDEISPCLRFTAGCGACRKRKSPEYRRRVQPEHGAGRGRFHRLLGPQSGG